MLDYFSNIVIPVIILFIIIYGKKQKIDIYESFINGAIEGLKTAWHILPYIIGIFLAIGIFKSGRGIEILEYIFSPMAKLFNIPKELIGLNNSKATVRKWRSWSICRTCAKGRN